MQKNHFVATCFYYISEPADFLSFVEEKKIDLVPLLSLLLLQCEKVLPNEMKQIILQVFFKLKAPTFQADFLIR